MYWLDDGLYFTDKNKTRLNQLVQHYVDNSNPDYNYDYYLLSYDDNTISRSAMLVSTATITFKVKGGTWKDGTTDDIVITKNVWEKLTQEELNKILSNIKDGSWDSIPNIDDYIKGDTVYTFTVSSVKGVTENPKTGRIFNSMILVILSGIFMVFYVRLMNKSSFK